MQRKETTPRKIQTTPIRLGLVLAMTLSCVAPSIADQDAKGRARYAKSDESAALKFTPIDLSNGSKLTLISPTRWSEAASHLIEVLNATHNQFTQLFTEIPPFSTSIRLMEENEFFELTGAPRWTNAMFYRGQIILPLVRDQNVDTENLTRSVKHEYTHAILSALSNGHIPGWIDEGLAQWFEGTETPGLRTALRTWLKTNEPVPLQLLQGGFTKLKSDMVPAAYAQSFLASRMLAERYGFPAISNYFFMLREGIEKEAAFATAFGITTKQFEKQVHRSLRKWADAPT